MQAPRVVVMGVCGSGKTTVGTLLAHALGVTYVDGDDLHPPRNVALMASGTPLTDDDRAEWLDAVAATLQATPQGLVVSCSALRRRYRDRLRKAAPDLRLLHLHGPRALLWQRMAARQGHYMPAALLDSQLQTLEPPAADERAVVLDIDGEPATLARKALDQLRARSPA